MVPQYQSPRFPNELGKVLSDGALGWVKQASMKHSKVRVPVHHVQDDYREGTSYAEAPHSMAG